MKLRWTPRAIADLEEISDYLVAVRLEAREYLLERVEHIADVLLDFPLIGKSGLVPATREFVLAGTPYILVFQLEGDAVVIVSVRDGRMQFPPGA